MRLNRVKIGGIAAGIFVVLASPWAYCQETPASVLPQSLPPRSVVDYLTVPSSVDAIHAIQQNILSGQYTDAIKAASKLLAERNTPAGSTNRYQLYMLKGEAFLGNKTMDLAISNFNSAQKESKEPRDIAVAKFTALLARQSPGGIYTPKAFSTTQPAALPIDLHDYSQRNAAMGVMLDGELNVLRPKVQSAEFSRSLQVILPVITQVQSLNQLDEIANGNTDKTKNIAGNLTSHAHEIIDSSLKDMSLRVDDISAHATQTTTSYQPTQIGGRYYNQPMTTSIGLSSSNTSELKTIIGNCGNIRQATDALVKMAGDDSDWASLSTEADRISSKANDVLNTNYSITTPAGGGTLPMGPGSR